MEIIISIRINVQKMYQNQLILIVFLVGSSFSAELLPTQANPNAGLTPEQLIETHGYPFEQHTVETSDGYLLTLHRIPYGIRNNNTDTIRPSVLIMHGLLSSSADFVNLGPQKAIAFLLADAGYDVWLGNQRGNTWSRKHIQLDPDRDSAKFFNFSLHELGTLDLPAKIDYILEATNQQNLFYIGHSQGTTNLFILLSAKPEYNAKIKMAATLAPVAYLKNAETPILKILDGKYNFVTEIMTNFSLYEILPYNPLIKVFVDITFTNPMMKEIGAIALSSLVGFDLPEFDRDFFPVMVSNCPAGVSIKQILHYLQIRQSDKFAFYNHGHEGNLDIYGQTEPPIYNLTQITTPIMLHYSENDFFAAIEDLNRLAEQLPNAQLKLVPRHDFNHLDFIYAIDIVELLNNDLIAEIKLFT